MGGASHSRTIGEPTTAGGHLLVVDDGSFAAGELLQELESHARRVIHASSGEQALELATHGGLDLILVASSVGDMSAMEFLRRARQTGVETGVVMLLDEASAEHVPEAHLGVLAFLPDSTAQEHVVATTALALGHQTLTRENRDMRRRLGLLESGEAVIGCSTASRRLLGVLARVSESSATVLIEGKVGSGKSLAARVIHMSGRRSERLHAVEPCANLSVEQLEESLEAANGGTITLEDVDELPAPTQSSLVRYLKERSPGGATGRPGLDVRIIATTSAHLPELVARGQFREDLYYRLNVFPIVIPSLMERRDDIPLLANHFLEQSVEQTGLLNKGVTPAAMILMEAHPWPENIAQLKNAVFRAHALANGMAIDRDQLLGPATGLQADRVPKNIFESPDDSDEEAPVREEDILPMESEEKRILARALKATGGNVRRAAQLLRIGRATLYRKIQVYKLRLH